MLVRPAVRDAQHMADLEINVTERPQGRNRVVIRAGLRAAKRLNIPYPERNRNFRHCLGVDDGWCWLVPTSISATDTQKLKTQSAYSNAFTKKKKGKL